METAPAWRRTTGRLHVEGGPRPSGAGGWSREEGAPRLPPHVSGQEPNVMGVHDEETKPGQCRN